MVGDPTLSDVPSPTSGDTVRTRGDAQIGVRSISQALEILTNEQGAMLVLDVKGQSFILYRELRVCDGLHSDLSSRPRGQRRPHLKFHNQVRERSETAPHSFTLFDLHVVRDATVILAKDVGLEHMVKFQPAYDLQLVSFSTPADRCVVSERWASPHTASEWTQVGCCCLTPPAGMPTSGSSIAVEILTVSGEMQAGALALVVGSTLSVVRAVNSDELLLTLADAEIAVLITSMSDQQERTLTSTGRSSSQFITDWSVAPRSH